MPNLNNLKAEEKHKLSNFWTGFAVGSVLVSASALMLGTKKGRETLKKLLEISENLEENLLSLAEEAEEKIFQKTDDIKNNFDKATERNKTHLGTLLDKIKIFS